MSGGMSTFQRQREAYGVVALGEVLRRGATTRVDNKVAQRRGAEEKFTINTPASGSCEEVGQAGRTDPDH